MKYNQALELHPHLSKLLDSFSFELAVNIPDQNSLSLLEILDMRKVDDISDEQFRQLYKDWLQSKNIFDIFTAKQVRTYPKHELIGKVSLSKYLESESVLGSLELLNTLYNDLYLARKNTDRKLLQDTEKLFDNLDSSGNIHLGLSSLFFLASAMIIQENGPIPLNYQQFKPIFKRKIKQFCEVEGMVSLRWFKNFFLFRGGSSNYPAQLLQILQELQRNVKKGDSRIKGDTLKLPDILTQTITRWKNTSRYSGIFQAKKKKIEIYQRIFTQNQQIFFFNGKDDNILNSNYFMKKYGENYIKSVELDTSFLRDYSQIFNQILNDYLSSVVKVGAIFGGKQGRHNQHASGALQTPSNQVTSNQNIYHEPYNPFKSSTQGHKKNSSGIYQQSGKLNNYPSFKQKTPKKKVKGHETRRFNVTPTHKNKKMSPQIRKHFGSTDKSRSKSRNMTPTKSFNGGYTSLYPQTAQVYRNSKKEGLEKDSFYQKLFFFRNKRVQSFDIVIKRLRGR